MFEDNSTGKFCKCALDHKRGMFNLKQQGFRFWKWPGYLDICMIFLIIITIVVVSAVVVIVFSCF